MTERVDTCRMCGTDHKITFTPLEEVRAAFKKMPHMIMSKSSSALHGTTWEMSDGLEFLTKKKVNHYRLDDETMRREFPDKVWDWENLP